MSAEIYSDVRNVYSVPSEGIPSVLIPEASFLLQGEFGRQGFDLVITNPAGEQFIVHDYFAFQPPPNLLLANGAGLSPEMVSSLLHVPFGNVAFAGPAENGNGPVIGKVTFLLGDVTVIRATGRFKLSRGDELYAGDQIETSDWGRVSARMNDGTRFRLGKSATATLDKFDESAKSADDDSSNFEATVLRGGFTYKSGAIGSLYGGTSRKHSLIKTPTAQIGIRGSELEGFVDPFTGQTYVRHTSGILDIADINGADPEVLDATGETAIIVVGQTDYFVVAPAPAAAQLLQAVPEMTQEEVELIEAADEAAESEREAMLEQEAEPAPEAAETEEADQEADEVAAVIAEEETVVDGSEDEGEEEEEAAEEDETDTTTENVTTTETRTTATTTDITTVVRGTTTQTSTGTYQPESTSYSDILEIDDGDTTTGTTGRVQNTAGTTTSTTSLTTTTVKTIDPTVEPEPELPPDNPPVARNDTVTLSTPDSVDLTELILANDFDPDPGQQPVITTISGNVDGVLSLVEGRVTFTPDADVLMPLALGETQVETFSYEVSSGGLTAEGEVTVVLSGVNDSPVATDRSFTVSGEDEQLEIDLFEGTSDPDAGDELRILVVAQNVSESSRLLTSGVALSEDTLTIDTTQFGDLLQGTTATIVYDYVVQDRFEASTTARIIITVEGDNLAPIAGSDEDETDEDSLLELDLLDNDSDGNDDRLGIVQLDTTGLTGTARIEEGGEKVFYLPPQDLPQDGVRTETFTYRVSDGFASDTATVTITVTGINDPPVINSDAPPVEIASDAGQVEIPLSAIFADADLGSELTVLELDTSQTIGTVIIGSVLYDSGGLFDYLGSGETATDSFGIRVEDEFGATGAGVYTVVITGTNEPPVFLSQPIDQVVDQATYEYQIAVADGDENDVLLLSSSVLPQFLTLDAELGLLSGTPQIADIGNYTILLSVSDGQITTNQSFTLSVLSSNTPPVAENDAFIIDEDVSFSANLLGNDSDVDNNVLAVSVLPGQGPVHGSLLLASNGEFTYFPDNNFAGSDSFSYQINDGRDTDTATVSIDIEPVNDGPFVLTGLEVQQLEQDQLFSFEIPADTFADVDDTNLTLIVTGLPDFLVLDGPTRIVGTPGNDDVDSYEIVVQANDPSGLSVIDTLSLTVLDVNDQPVVESELPDLIIQEGDEVEIPILATTFSDADGDNLSLNVIGLPAALVFSTATLTISGVPDDADVGVFEVTVIAADGRGGSASTPFMLTVENVNDNPLVAVPIPDLTATENVSFTYTIPATTFSDEDDDNLELFLSNVPSFLEFDGLGTLTGIPVDADVGSYSLFVEAFDGQGGMTTDVFVLTVVNVNNPPVRLENINDVTVLENDNFSLTIPLSNYEDSDGDDLSISISGLTPGLIFDGTNVIAGIPDDIDVGTRSITVTVSDPLGATVTDSFNLTVTNVNDQPVLLTPVADVTTTENATFSLSIPAAMFDDADGDNLTIAVTGLPGDLVFDQGTISGVPGELAVGQHEISIEASDPFGGVATNTFLLTINNVNNAPVAVNDDYTLTEDSSGISANVLDNDTDSDVGNVLSVLLLQDVSAGNLSLLPDGSFQYAPVANFDGTDGFRYRVTDGLGGTASATATLTVTPVNDIPFQPEPFQISLPEGSGVEVINLTDTVFDVEDDNLTVSNIVISSTLGILIEGESLLVDTDLYQFLGNEFTETITVNWDVTDSDGATIPATGSLRIVGFNNPPDLIEPVPDQVISEGVSFSLPGLSTVFSDAEDDTLILTVSGLPQGLVFDGSDEISGTPDDTDVGSYTITIEADDGEGGRSTDSFSLTIDPVNDSPVINRTFSQNATLEDDVDFLVDLHLLVDATDADGDVTGVVVINNATTTEGAWEYSTNGGLNVRVIDTEHSPENALVLDLATTTIRFVPAPDFYGPVPSLTIRALDDTFDEFSQVPGLDVLMDASVFGGNTGISASTGILTTSVTAINDAPEIMLPLSGFIASHNLPKSLTGIEFGDAEIDQGVGQFNVTLSVASGILNAASAGAASVVGDGSLTVMITANSVDLAATLSSLSYTGDDGFFGTDTLTITVSDLGNFPGPAETATATTNIEISGNPLNTLMISGSGWSSAANWSLARTPLFTDDAFVPAGFGVSIGSENVDYNILNVNGSLTVNNAILNGVENTVFNDGAMLIDVGTGTFASTVTIATGATATFGSGTQATIASFNNDVNNAGLIELSGGNSGTLNAYSQLVMANGSTLTNTGTIHTQGPYDNRFINGNINNIGLIDIDHPTTFHNGSSTIDNSLGHFDIASTLTINGNGEIRLGSGSQITGNGTLSFVGSQMINLTDDFTYTSTVTNWAVRVGTVTFSDQSQGYQFINDGSLTFQDSTDEVFDAAFFNRDGYFQLQATSEFGIIRFNGGLTNSGTIELSGGNSGTFDASSRLIVDSAETLLNHPEGLILTSGSYDSRFINANIDNQGEIRADRGMTITGEVNNTGLITTNNGSVITNTGTFDTSAGELAFNNGATLNISGGTTLLGSGTVISGSAGTLKFSGTQTVQLLSDFRFDDPQVTTHFADGAITVDDSGGGERFIVGDAAILRVVSNNDDFNAALLIENSTGVNPGVLRLGTSSVETVTRFDGGIENNGLIELTGGNSGTFNAYSQLIVDSASMLVNNPDGLILSTGTYDTRFISANIDNQGEIRADRGMTITGEVNNTGLITTNNGSVITNTGTFDTSAGELAFNNGATLNISGGTTLLGSGTVISGSAGTLKLSGTQTVQLLSDFRFDDPQVTTHFADGAITVDDSGGGERFIVGDAAILRVVSNDDSFNAALLIENSTGVNPGVLRLGNSSVFTVSRFDGGIENNGLIELTGGNSGTFNAYAQLIVDNASMLVNNPDGLILSTGTYDTRFISANIDNQGEIRADRGVTITGEVNNTGLITTNNGSVITNTGTFDTSAGELAFNNGATLNISGGTTLLGSGTVISGSAGTLKFSGTQTVQLLSDFRFDDPQVTTHFADGAITVDDSGGGERFIVGDAAILRVVSNDDSFNAALLIENSTGVNPGVLRLGNSSVFTVSRFDGGIENNGLIELTGGNSGTFNAYAQLIVNSASMLVNNPDGLILSTGTYDTRFISANIDNQGEIRADRGVTITGEVNNTGLITTNNGSVITNTGTFDTSAGELAFNNGATLNISGGTTLLGSGTAISGSAGTLKFSGTQTVQLLSDFRFDDPQVTTHFADGAITVDDSGGGERFIVGDAAILRLVSNNDDFNAALLIENSTGVNPGVLRLGTSSVETVTRFDGGIENNGLIELTGGNSGTFNAYAQLIVDSASMLVNNPDGLILSSGSYDTRFINANIDNQGEIRADRGVTITGNVDNTGLITINSGSVITNTGTFDTSAGELSFNNGATLNISGGTTLLGSGTVISGDGGILKFSGTQTVQLLSDFRFDDPQVTTNFADGAITVEDSGGGEKFVVGDDSVLHLVSDDDDFNAALLIDNSTGSNPGVLRLGNSSVFTVSRFDGGIENNGLIELTGGNAGTFNAYAQLIVDNATMLVNNPDGLILSSGSYDTRFINANVDNQGEIRADRGVTITGNVDNTGLITINSGSEITNTGTFDTSAGELSFNNGATLNINGGTTLLGSGTVVSGSAGTLKFSGTQTVQLISDFRFDQPNVSSNFKDGLITINDSGGGEQFIVGDGARFTVASQDDVFNAHVMIEDTTGGVNPGVLHVGSTNLVNIVSFSNGIDNNGTIQLRDGNAGTFNAYAQILMTDGSVLHNTGVIQSLGSYDGRFINGHIENDGLIDVDFPLTINNTDSLLENSMGHLDLASTLTISASGNGGEVALGAGSQITGSGTLAFSGPQLITLTDDFIYTSSSTNWNITGGAVTIDDHSLGYQFINEGSLTFSNSGDEVFNAVFDNRGGYFALQSGSNFQLTRFNEGLVNSGTIDLRGGNAGVFDAYVQLIVDDAALLTNLPGGLLLTSGSYDNRYINANIDNQGEIRAGFGVNISGVVTNSGLMTANADMTLNNLGIFDTTDGELSVNNNATFNISGGTTLVGNGTVISGGAGTLKFSGTQTIELASDFRFDAPGLTSNFQDGDVTVDDLGSGARFIVGDGTRFRLASTDDVFNARLVVEDTSGGQNPGVLHLGSGSVETFTVFNDGIENAGLIQLRDGNAGTFNAYSQLILGNNSVLTNTGTIQSLGPYDGRFINGNIDNQGLVDVDYPLTIFNGGANLDNESGQIDLASTLTLDSGTETGQLTLGLASSITGTGSLTFVGTHSVLLTSDYTHTSRTTLWNTNNASVTVEDVSPGAIFRIAGDLRFQGGGETFDAGVEVTETGVLRIGGSSFTSQLFNEGLDNRGLIQLGGGSSGIGDQGSNLILASGTVLNNQAGGVLVSDGTLDSRILTGDVNNAGEVRIDFGLTQNGNFVNAGGGLLDLNQNLSINGDLTNQSGGTIEIEHNLTVSGTFNNDGLLISGAAGNRQLNGLLNNQGTIAPGGYGIVGNLILAGAVVQTAAAVIDVDVNSTVSHDTVSALGAVNTAGNVNLNFLPGNSFSDGESITFLTYGSRSGTDTFSFTHNLGAGFEINAVYSASDVVLTLNSNFSTSFDNENLDGDWQQAINWAGDVVPGGADNAVLDGMIVNLSSGAAMINSVTLLNSSNLTMSAGSLVINSNSLIESGSSFAVSGGALTLDGTIVNRGLITFSGGTFTGSGSINNIGDLTLSSVLLGTSVINLGNLTTINSANQINGELDNQAGGVFTVDASTNAFGYTTVSNLVNAGLVEIDHSGSSTGNYSNLNISGTLTNAPGGIVRSMDSGDEMTANVFHLLTGSVTNRGTLDVTHNLSLVNQGKVFDTREGVVQVARGEVLNIDGGGGGTTVLGSDTTFLETGTGTGTAIIRFSSNQTLDLVSDFSLVTNHPSFDLAPGSVTIDASVGTATFSLEAGTSFTLDGNDRFNSSVMVVNQGDLTGMNSANQINGGLDNQASGVFTVDASTNAFGNTTVSNLVNAGLVEIDHSGISTGNYSHLVVSGTLTNVPGGIVRSMDSGDEMTANVFHLLTGSVTNQGTLDVTHNLSLLNQGEVFDTREGVVQVALGEVLNINGGSGGTTVLGADTTFIETGSGVDTAIIRFSSNQTLDLASDFTLTTNHPTFDLAAGSVAIDASVGAATFSLDAGTRFTLDGNDRFNSSVMVVNQGDLTGINSANQINGGLDNQAGGVFTVDASTNAFGDTTVSNLVNAGLVEIDHSGSSTGNYSHLNMSGTLTNAPGSILRSMDSGDEMTANVFHLLTGSVINQGTLDVTHNLSLVNQGKVFDTREGVVQVARGEVLNINGGGGGTTVLGADTTFLESGTGTATATIRFTSTQTLDLVSDFSLTADHPTFDLAVGNVTLDASVGAATFSLNTGSSFTLDGNDRFNSSVMVVNQGDLTGMNSANQINGGLDNQAGGVFTVDASTNAFGDTTVSNLVNAGLVEIDHSGSSTGNYSHLNVSGTLTNAPGGIVRSMDTGGEMTANVFHLLTGSVINQGTLDVTHNLSLVNQGKVFDTREGVVQVARGEVLNINGGGGGTTVLGADTTFLESGTGTATATIRFTSTQTLDLVSDFSLTADHPTFDLAVGNVTLVASVGAATFSLNTGSSFTLDGNDRFNSSVMVVNQGDLTGMNSANQINGGLDNQAGGVFTVDASTNAFGDTTVSNLVNAGLVEIDHSGSSTGNYSHLNVSGTLTNAPGGIVRSMDTGGEMTANVFHILTGQLNNEGELDVLQNLVVNSTESHSNSGILTVSSGETLRFSGTSIQLVNEASGLVQGNGLLDLQSVAFVNRGIINPGNEIDTGTLTVSGNVNLEDSSELFLELEGTVAGASHDQLSHQSSGVLTLGGRLNVGLINAFVPAVGNTFVLVSSFATLAGEFATAAGLDVSTSVVLDIATVSNDVVATAVAVTQAGTTATETISLSAGIDVVVAGVGDDQVSLISSGDTVYGQGGNDRLETDGDFNRIDGGGGVDTLHISTGYDLQSVNSLAVERIEILSVDDLDSDIVELDANAIVAIVDGMNDLTGVTNSLVVTGNPGDVLRLHGTFGLDGSATLDTGAGPEQFNIFREGDIFVYLDGDIALEVVLPGGDIQFFGTTSDETLFGSPFDDFLDGGAGADTLFGESGNDHLIFDAADLQIDGGAGIDKVSFLGGENIDLSNVNNLSGIEHIEMAGAGNLNLAMADVFNGVSGLVDELDAFIDDIQYADHQLLVSGELDDSLTIEGVVINQNSTNVVADLIALGVMVGSSVVIDGENYVPLTKSDLTATIFVDADLYPS